MLRSLHSPLGRCASCRRVSYCSKACQQAHWKLGHKKQCRAWKAARKQVRQGGPLLGIEIEGPPDWARGVVSFRQGTGTQIWEGIQSHLLYHVPLQATGLTRQGAAGVEEELRRAVGSMSIKDAMAEVYTAAVSSEP
jgi:hypothetical protein